MSETFVVCNQLGQFWGKKKRWVDGNKARKIMLCKHADEGLNLLVELSSKDIDLRGEVIPVALDERGLPEVEPSKHLLEDEDPLEIPADDPTLEQEPEELAAANGDVAETSDPEAHNQHSG